MVALALQARKLNDIDAIVLVDVGPLDSANLVKLQENLESGGAILSLFGPNSKPTQAGTSGAQFRHHHPQATTLTDLLGFSLDVPSAPGDYQVDPLVTTVQLPNRSPTTSMLVC